MKYLEKWIKDKLQDGYSDCSSGWGMGWAYSTKGASGGSGGCFQPSMNKLRGIWLGVTYPEWVMCGSKLSNRKPCQYSDWNY